MAKVLVTGGAGFIGSHTVDSLGAAGHEVRVIDSLQERVHPLGQPSWLDDKTEFLNGDVTNVHDLARALEGVDAVFHLAAYQDHQPDYHQFVHTNSESLARMFALAASEPSRFPFKVLLYASSQAACGEGHYVCSRDHEFWPGARSLEQLGQGLWDHQCPECDSPAEPLPMDAVTCSAPTNAYGVSKLCKELLARALGPRLGIGTVGLRYTHVLGPRNSVHNAYSGLARRSLMLLHENRAPRLYEDGRQYCDFVDVRDVAAANLLAYQTVSEANARVYNVGGPTNTTVLDLANEICRVYGSELKPAISGEYRVGDPRHMISDSSPLRALGWRPTIPLRTTVSDYVEWFESQPWSSQYFHQAERALRGEGVARVH